MSENGTRVVPMPRRIQQGPDTGLLALAIIGREHQKDIDPASVAHEIGLVGRPSSPYDLVRAAKIVGLRARHVSDVAVEQIIDLPRPLILRMKDGGYYILTRLKNGADALRDPLGVRPSPASVASWSANWSGDAILVTIEAQSLEEDKEFGLRWFIDAAKRYKRPLIHVLILSMFIQLFALVTPLFFQIVVDKVLLHKTISTLQVVVVSLLVINVFDVVLQYLRSYALYHTASRIDVQLGSQIVRKLFQLPLAYFESRPTGQTVARIREVETVRAFLTGQALTSVIDGVFTIGFLAFLFSYSVKMAVIVMCMIPLYILAVATVRPLLRQKIKERFNSGAYSQQFLVESIVGASTLKAASVEPIVQQQWELRLATYVKISFQTVMLGSVGQLSVQFVSKLTTALILFFGAMAVMNNEMTVGQLVAFNMISGQLIAPIIRLSQLWQDIQQIQISIDRLGDIFNETAEEHSSSMTRLPTMQVNGAISLERVTFRYRAGVAPALDNINLEIPAGQVLGVVGPSGSGKSTLTKMIQRMYIPESGQVMIDQTNLAQVHPAWFRRQIGVVLQENLLFNRTIHENIAIATPFLSRDQVAAIAKLAGADEFVRELPAGYDTLIEERGANLSGGQRQRIAIARALATNPRILIFDEATSALDYESERVIQSNMREIVKGRTVVIVAHRLAAVRDCDRIIAMRKGKIVEDGTHQNLLSIEGGLYAQLFQLQQR